MERRSTDISEKQVLFDGTLKMYQGMLSGYRECQLRLLSNQLVVQREKRQRVRQTVLELAATPFVVSKHPKESTDFAVTAGTKGKVKKLFFRVAKDSEERDAWVSQILKAQDFASEVSKQVDCGNSLFDTFASKLFVDECDLDVKLQAFREVESAFKQDMSELEEMVRGQGGEEWAAQRKKMGHLRNLSKTMSDLVRSIVAEVEDSREQMFNMIEALRESVEQQPKGGEKHKAKSWHGRKISTHLSSAPCQSLPSLEDEEEKLQYEDCLSNQEDEDDAFEDASAVSLVPLGQHVVASKTAIIADVFEERLTLPHLRPPTYKVSFWRILKDLIGKDLTRVSMPIYFNEPLSMLQKIAETCEYDKLYDEAAQIEDQYLRLAYVSCCFCIRYAGQEDRRTKPFNPLLGETYELVTDRYRFVAEQVSHHPPISVYCMQSKNYEAFTNCRTSLGFNGRQIYYQPQERSYFRVKKADGSQELFSTNMPVTSVHNLVIGKLYTDTSGQVVVKNHATGDYCEFEYKKRGWKGQNAFCVFATVRDHDGNPKYEVEGQYNKKLLIRNLDTGEEKVVWEAHDKPQMWDHMYYFSKFALQLNYLPQVLKDKIPPTDSRLRPDQRFLEEGKTEEATQEKLRLEENQRQRRKKMEEEGVEYSPRYFEVKKIEETGEDLYVFNGKYWEDRERKNWDHLAPIFE